MPHEQMPRQSVPGSLLFVWLFRQGDSRWFKLLLYPVWGGKLRLKKYVHSVVKETRVPGDESLRAAWIWKVVNESIER